MDERVIAQKAPFEVEVEAGKAYWWCACGRSAAQPFCDGSHKSTTFTPLKWVAGAAEPVWFCGCKQTGARRSATAATRHSEHDQPHRCPRWLGRVAGLGARRLQRGDPSHRRRCARRSGSSTAWRASTRPAGRRQAGWPTVPPWRTSTERCRAEGNDLIVEIAIDLVVQPGAAGAGDACSSCPISWRSARPAATVIDRQDFVGRVEVPRGAHRAGVTETFSQRFVGREAGATDYEVLFGFTLPEDEALRATPRELGQADAQAGRHRLVAAPPGSWLRRPR